MYLVCSYVVTSPLKYQYQIPLSYHSKFLRRLVLWFLAGFPLVTARFFSDAFQVHSAALVAHSMHVLICKDKDDSVTMSTKSQYFPKEQFGPPLPPPKSITTDRNKRWKVHDWNKKQNDFTFLAVV